MKLVTFERGGAQRAGALRDDGVVDLQATDSTLPDTVLGLIQGGEVVLARARKAAEVGSATPLADVRLLAPIPRPPKIVCIGVNYADHVAEVGRAAPTKPSVFMKAASTVIGTGQAIVKPPTTEQLDYEVEFSAVIGKQARRVSRNEALDYVAGWTIMNDASARDRQLSADGGIIVGKNFDTSAPMGPAITLVDELPDATHLRVRTWVNGELRQDSNTHHLIFDVPAIIEYVSAQLTLEPGDIIATGTPSGVGLGMKPPRWLQPGDVVRMEIDRLGVLENTVAAP